MLPKLRAYAELLRVSNVLTAVADVWMGMIVATGTLAPASVSVPLTLTSVCLYLSGMVLNDVFDAKRDAKERPTRPIPSGRITRTEAACFGSGLMLLGIGFAYVSSLAQKETMSMAIAMLLAVLILLYNSRLKQTALGPLLMGLCRGANAAIGLTAFCTLGPQYKGLPRPPDEGGWIVAGLTLYVVGVTVFAATEAHAGRRWRLLTGAAASFAGVAFLAGIPWTSALVWVPVVEPWRWMTLWIVITLIIARKYAAAILQPTPKHIQAAVGNAIQGIILIDAALAWGYAGPFWGLAILALLPPTMLMAKFIPQT